ncbi:polyphosphate kinase 2, partial [Escherichia coli]|nr:polyphosphate kinase 2 [Escherichia coli]
WEEHLAENGTVILKFFLNVSKKEQRRRFLSRIEEPSKNWKFSMADVRERAYWDDYMFAYEEAITATSTQMAPWFII